MIYSMNEIEHTVRKAARGAGLSWGMAEEAGKAVRWLEAHGLPGLSCILSALENHEHNSLSELSPNSLEQPWHNAQQQLCPLVSGMLLCDHTTHLPKGEKIEIHGVAHPLLLLPFVGQSVLYTEYSLQISWKSVLVQCANDGISVSGSQNDLTLDQVEQVVCEYTKEPDQLIDQHIWGIKADPEIWAGLGKLAHRTYVKATEASRLAGAGAGVNDND